MSEKKKTSLTEEEKTFCRIHKETARFRDGPLDKHFIPPLFKEITGKRIPLPKDLPPLDIPLEKVIHDRVSSRRFSGSMTKEEVSRILRDTYGFKNFEDGGPYGLEFRNMAPSAGSRHQVELYVILQRVEGIEDGVYHYNIREHALEVISEGLPERGLVQGVVNGKEDGLQRRLADANMLVIMSAIHRRASWKYGPRAYRFAHLDAGHASQNIYLIATALGLGVCGVGSWDDKAIERLLRIDGEREVTVYVTVVGKKAGSGDST